MAFVDEITIHVKAGRGGDGVVRWRHEKGRAKAGAGGGNGGRGGNVVLKAVSDLSVLATYRQIKEFSAENGAPGENWSRHGKDGDDMVVKIPVGSIITNIANGDVYTLEKPDEEIIMATGGRGGLGNEHFKASTNTTPQECTPGKEGEEFDLQIELELVADVGLVGLPNAGKSSLLNALTRANAKVGNYQFTTLEPNLGDLYGVIIADIPGLIEGASEGKGLGHKFLKHVKRTKMIAHLVGADNEKVLEVYNTVRKELEVYDTELAAKEEVIVLSKIDMVSPEEIEVKKKLLATTGRKVFTLSTLDDDSLKEFKDTLTKLVRKDK
ncbi:MAG: GTPase ObgE, GTP-binding protein [Candidatus Parcubacteria bacterium]|jgi:GTP-binding protein